MDTHPAAYLDRRLKCPNWDVTVDQTVSLPGNVKLHEYKLESVLHGAL